MKNTTPKKSIADFSKNAMVPTQQLYKIKGGSDSTIKLEESLIIVEDPIS